MSPDKIAIILAIAFIGLLFTHYLALKIGWRMGTKTEPAASLPNMKITKPSPYIEKPDIYDEERLDFD